MFIRNTVQFIYSLKFITKLSLFIMIFLSSSSIRRSSFQLFSGLHMSKGKLVPGNLAYATPKSQHSSQSNSLQSRERSDSLTKYELVPTDLKLKKVVVVHRHGDRTPIQRQVAANFPERPHMIGKWSSTLPSLQTLSRLEKVGRLQLTNRNHNQYQDLPNELYVGGDASTIPYGQLTETGSQQLINLGSRLRYLYGNHRSENSAGWILAVEDHEALSNSLYCRSTYLCRTIHSIRSLLVGLYDIDLHREEELTISEEIHPTIYTRIKAEESLYPQVDGPCPVILAQRYHVEKVSIRPHIQGIDEITKKLEKHFQFDLKSHLNPINSAATTTAATNTTAGIATTAAITPAIPNPNHKYLHPIPWLNLQEVFHCYLQYNMFTKAFPFLQPSDSNKVKEIISRIWGELYYVSAFYIFEYLSFVPSSSDTSL